MPGGGEALRLGTDGAVVTHSIQTPVYGPYALKQECTDEVNRRDKDNPLLIEFESRNLIPFNGEFGIPGTSGYRKYTNYYPQGHYASYGHPSMTLSGIPSVGTVATAVLARSNPSRPDVSIPNFLYELKDLPGMIRDIGRLRIQGRNAASKGIQRVHPKVLASHYLSYEMGWRPLIADLRRLLDFQSNVDKKMRELENLYNKGGLQRRVRLPSWKWVNNTSGADDVFTLQSHLGIVHNFKRTAYHEFERWGTVRWYPASRPDSRFSQADMARLARDLSFGMKGISTKQVWDAIPWTWLIGWFTNVDDFLQAHDNRIPLTHSVPCIMTKRFSRYDFVRIPSTPSWAQGGTGAILISTKERTMSSGSLSASIPFLRGRQLSILSALHLQRRR